MTARFNVDQLGSVSWNDAAFDSLMLPGNEKRLAWEFVENKALSDNSFDDFIEDKGMLHSKRFHIERFQALSNSSQVVVS